MPENPVQGFAVSHAKEGRPAGSSIRFSEAFCLYEMLDQTRYKTTGIWETEYSTHRKPQPNIIL